MPRPRKVPDLPEGFSAATPNEWLPLWDRVITTTPVKAVGYAAVRFAGWKDGTGIRPGNVILARICGCSTRSVERAFTKIRELGLMVRYHKGCREGDADIYRLTIPDDALEKLPLLDVDWALPEPAPDCESGADCVSGDSQSAPDTVSDLPDTQSGAHPTESRRTSTETSTRTLQDTNTAFDLAGVEGAHACEVKIDAEGFEAEQPSRLAAVPPPGARCRYGNCRTPADPVPDGEEFHRDCRYLAAVKAPAARAHREAS